MIDSRTAIRFILDRPVYSTSAAETDNSDIWIQAPLAAQQYESPEPKLIDGIYAQSRKIEIFGNSELVREFAAWEAASDEALLNFEKGLR
jgi:hypothetical protein